MQRQLRIREPIGGLRTRIVTAEEIERFRHRQQRIANANTTADDVDLETIRSHEL